MLSKQARLRRALARQARDIPKWKLASMAYHAQTALSIAKEVEQVEAGKWEPEEKQELYQERAEWFRNSVHQFQFPDRAHWEKEKEWLISQGHPDLGDAMVIHPGSTAQAKTATLHVAAEQMGKALYYMPAGVIANAPLDETDSTDPAVIERIAKANQAIHHMAPPPEFLVARDAAAVSEDGIVLQPASFEPVIYDAAKRSGYEHDTLLYPPNEDDDNG